MAPRSDLIWAGYRYGDRIRLTKTVGKTVAIVRPADIFGWGEDSPTLALNLAFAILSDYLDKSLALTYYVEFSAEVIARLPHAAWVMDRNYVLNWHDARSKGCVPIWKVFAWTR